MSLSKFMEKQTSFNPLVIGATLFFVVLLVAMILIVPEQTQTLLNAAKSGIFANFSWFYVLAFSVFLGFLVILLGGWAVYSRKQAEEKARQRALRKEEKERQEAIERKCPKCGELNAMWYL